MAMTEDTDVPRLFPPDDRLPDKGKLLRRPEELTDDQFDLLAAAWADGALSGDSLAEGEAVMAASPERRLRAESFRQIRLSPLNDRWEGRNRMLKTAPGAYAIRRTLIVTLTAAAALGALIILGPLKSRPDSKSTRPDVARAYPMGEALIPKAAPVVVSVPEEVVASATHNLDQTEMVTSATRSPNQPGLPASSSVENVIEPRAAGMIAQYHEPGAATVTAQDSEPRAATVTAQYREPRTAAVTPEPGDRQASIMTPGSRDPQTVDVMIHGFSPGLPLLAAGPEASRLAPVEMKAVTRGPAAGRDDNWIMRGVSLLAQALTKDKKSVDGYFIADACIRGVNRVLGWEMELEQEKNNAGEPLTTNFSSSLLTFSSPAKKNQP